MAHASEAALFFRARARLCALPLPGVVETMRPLPVRPLPGAPPFVRGASVIRGAPVPVVDVGALLGDPAGERASRFVLLRLGERRVALAVEEVIGVRELPSAQLDALPPLLKDAGDVVSRVAALDAELLLVLGTARWVPDSLWRAAEAGGAA